MPATPETAPYGNLDHLDDGRWQLRFTRQLGHPLERVWEAITEPDQLARWFPTSIDGERRAGAPLRFEFPEGQAPPMAGRMLAFQPPTLMELQWGPDTIRIELEANDGGTLLRLLDTLEARGKGARDGAGWHVCLASLSAYLEGMSTAREVMGAWHEVHPHYVESFGPEAATIGPPAGLD